MATFPCSLPCCGGVGPEPCGPNVIDYPLDLTLPGYTCSTDIYGPCVLGNGLGGWGGIYVDIMAPVYCPANGLPSLRLHGRVTVGGSLCGTPQGPSLSAGSDFYVYGGFWGGTDSICGDGPVLMPGDSCPYSICVVIEPASGCGGAPVTTSLRVIFDINVATGLSCGQCPGSYGRTCV